MPSCDFSAHCQRGGASFRKAQLIMVPLMQVIHETCEQNGLSYWLDFGTLLGAYRHKGFIPWDDDVDLGMMRADAEKLAAILQDDPRVEVANLFGSYPGKPNGLTQLFRVRHSATSGGKLRYGVDIFYYDYAQVGGNAARECIRQEKEAMTTRATEWPRTEPGSEQKDPEIQSALRTVFEEFYKDAQEKLGLTYEPGPYIVWGMDNLDLFKYLGPLSAVFSRDMVFPLAELEFEGRVFHVPNRFRDYLDIRYGDIFSLPSDMLSHRHLKSGDWEKEQELINDCYRRFFE